jgi:hypothetical protein
MAASTAPLLWAQRNDSLYLTINLSDVKDAKIELTDAKLVFRCVYRNISSLMHKFN